MNDNRFPKPPADFEPLPAAKRRRRPPLPVLAVVILSAAMLLFSLLYKQFALQVEPGRIAVPAKQGQDVSFAARGHADETPVAGGVVLLGPSGAAAQTAAVASRDEEDWVYTGTMPQPALPGDATVSYALYPGTLYVSAADPTEDYAASEAAITIQRISDESGGLRLQFPLTGLNPDGTYLAGFMAGEDMGSLRPFGDATQIAGETSRLLTAEGTLSLPRGEDSAVCVAYVYPLSGDTVLIAGQAWFDPSAASLPAQTAQPTPTAAPAAVSAPEITVYPSFAIAQPAAQTTPSHPYFNLYAIDTRYYFHQLTEREQAVFAALYDGVMAFDTDIAIPDCTGEELDRAVFALQYDCPELFQMAGGYRKYYRGQNTYFSVSPEYVMDAAQYETELDALLETVAQMQTADDFGTTERSKELSVYRDILARTSYSVSLPYCDSAIGPLVYGYGKCDGYAKALSFALRYYGIPSAEICGEAAEIQNATGIADHSWNYVSVGGQWYQCDLTWDDGASGDKEPQTDFLPFFNLTDQRILNSRTIWSEFSAWELPRCDSTAAYYYSDHGTTIRQGEDFSEKFNQAVTEAYQSGAGSVPLVFETAQAYQQALNQIEAASQNWREGRTRLRSFSYLYSDEGLVIYLFNMGFTG